MTQPSSNRNLIIVFAIVAAISLTFGIQNFHKASPEIGIDFRVSRDEAVQNARTYLESRQIDLSGFRQTITLSGSGSDKIYIEKELGVERLTSLAEDTLSLWNWRVRFFKPLQKLEYSVYIDTKGRIKSFRRDIEESAPGLSLDTTAAKLLGEAFLSGPTGIDLEKWKHVETTTIDRPNRRDYTFTYEKIGFKIKEATYRLTVELQGSEISRYYYQVREPEDWWRDWDKQRAQNDLFSDLATGAMLLTLIGVFYYFFRHVKQGKIPWKTGIWLSAVLGFSTFVMGINSIPLELAWAETTESYGSFLLGQIVQSLLQGIFLAGELLLLYGAGEYLYRTDFPGKLSLPSIFTRRGMRSKEFFEATIMGYLLCAFDIGFITLFYVVGSKFGFWSPAEIKYDESVSTYLPWIYPLAISFYASLTEEFWFRLFGISLFKRITKSNLLAVLIPAMIWAFLHSNYPQTPGYARGIELTIVGVVAGLVMIRFGIWATLVYHYVYDAVLIGLFLFRSDNTYFWISGLIVCGFMLVPAVIAGIGWLKQRKFEEVEDLLNGNQIELEEPQIEHPHRPILIEPEQPAQLSTVQPFSIAKRRNALIIGSLGLLILLIPAPRQFGDQFEWAIDQSRAVAIASDLVKNRYSIDPNDYKIAVRVRGNSEKKFLGASLEAESADFSISYLKKHASIERAEQLLLSKTGRQIYSWNVSFKRPLDQNEFSVSVPMNGSSPHSFKIIADSLSGADLPVDSARTLAANVFQTKVADAADFHQVEERSIKRPNRRDWYFTYESINPVVGEAYFRETVEVLGDEANVGTRWIKIPEEWRRQEREKRIGTTILRTIGVLGLIFMLYLVLRSLGTGMRAGQINWAGGRRIALIAALAMFASTLLKLPEFWFAYDTAKPVWSVYVSWAVPTVSAALFIFGFALLVVVLAESLSNLYSGQNRHLGFTPPKVRWNRDDATTLFVMVGTMLGLSSLISWLTGTFDLPTHTWAIGLTDSLNSCQPTLYVLTASLGSSIMKSCVIVTLFLLTYQIVKKPHHRWWMIAIGAILVASQALNISGNWTAGESIWRFVQIILIITIGYNVLNKYGVGKLAAITSAFLITQIVEEGFALSSLRGLSYQYEGWILLAIATTLFVALLLIGYKSADRVSES